MLDYIKKSLEDSAKIKCALASGAYPHYIESVSNEIVDAYRLGKKVLAFGNGGSAADAQHFVAELVGWYKVKDRRPLEAICLNTNVSNLTAIANDAGYENVFSRQVEAFGNNGDVAFGISTSGNSPNVVNAFAVAKRLGVKTVALTGALDSKLSAMADYAFKVPSDDTPRIQEAHIAVIHIICDLVERKLFLGK